ncbi:thioester dehydrase [Arenicella chitinivorans]|uniref:Thioester dehydrase n=1 Tax=Arenicella chitinivorans TaxID=1329800 RepID=A0A918VQN3_9GAMM|nr:thioester dehydrase [Arenicella chitinivorans]GHA14579.1 thioester dehydrase [Arenicella chitinivorans]
MPSITPEQLNAQLDAAQWPRFHALVQRSDQAIIELEVPDDLRYFAGHFPQQAVLPGVVQVHWVGELAARLFAVGAFTELKSLKFNSMVLPNTWLRLTLDFHAEKSQLKFSYATQEQYFSSGVLVFKSGDRQ